mgnify:FL=1
MMGVKTITNKLVGATKEEWFKLKGIELVEHMRQARPQILKTIVDLLDD